MYLECICQIENSKVSLLILTYVSTRIRHCMFGTSEWVDASSRELKPGRRSVGELSMARGVYTAASDWPQSGVTTASALGILHY